jgi:hypothetical protein
MYWILCEIVSKTASSTLSSNLRTTGFCFLKKSEQLFNWVVKINEIETSHINYLLRHKVQFTLVGALSKRVSSLNSVQTSKWSFFYHQLLSTRPPSCERLI